MGTTSSIIVSVWGAVILARVAALICVVTRGLARSYPVLTAYLMYCSVSSGLRLYAFFGGPGAYLHAWGCSQPILIGFHAALVLEVYALQGRCAAKFRWPGTVLLSIFALGSIGAIYAMARFEYFSGAAPHLVLVTRHWDSVSLIVVVASRAWFAAWHVAIPQNVILHSWLITLLLSGSVAGSLAREIGGYWLTAIAQFLILGSAGAAYALWAARLVPEGQAIPASEPRNLEEERRFHIAETELRWRERESVRACIARLLRWLGLPVV